MGTAPIPRLHHAVLDVLHAVQGLPAALHTKARLSNSAIVGTAPFPYLHALIDMLPEEHGHLAALHTMT